jgi:RNA polymerase sigma-70 factor, ECF subfamily
MMGELMSMDEPIPDASETETLLRLAKAGDRSAVDQLLLRHRGYLHKVAALRLDQNIRARVDESDIVQEAQLEAARRMPEYLKAPPPIPFRLWLRRLACDAVLMQRRHHAGAARRAVRREVGLPDQSSLLLADRLLAPGVSPSQQVSRQELARRVGQAVAELPDIDREILLMRTFEGLPFDEVACVVGIDAATARKRHGRALIRLHKLLSDGGLTGSQI